MIKIPRISSSTLSTLKNCPTKFRNVYVLEQSDDAPPLRTGAAFALGVQVTLENWTKGSHEDAIALGVQALLKALPSHYKPPRDPENVTKALVGYFDKWGDVLTNVYIPQEIEFTFALPILESRDPNGDPYIYEGKIDHLDLGPDGLWITDEKTTTQMGPTWPAQWPVRSQFFSYMWACWETGREVSGVLIRGVGFARAQPPRFLESRVLYLPHLVSRWYESTLYWLERLTEFLTKDQWPMVLDDACNVYSGCPFRDSCSAENPEEWLMIDRGGEKDE